MNLITISYFQGLVNIPFNNKNTTDFENMYMTPLEEKILVNTMGRKTYDEFITGLNESTILDKWKDLLNGKTFDVKYNGITTSVRWNGLLNDEKISFISDYVYYNWLAANYTQLTGLGVVENNKENAKTVDIREKYLFAQSRASGLIGSYPKKKVLGSDLNVNNIDILEPTLLNFLYHNISDYPELIFTPLKKSNYFDL